MGRKHRETRTRKRCVELDPNVEVKDAKHLDFGDGFSMKDHRWKPAWKVGVGRVLGRGPNAD